MEKYSMSMDQDFAKLVTDLSLSDKNPAKDKSDLIRRAVTLYAYLHEQISANPNSKLAILDNSDQILKIIDPLP